MSGLDEHSVFLDERALTNLTEQTTGHFGGIGIEVTLDDGAFKIIAPIDDTPAQRAGSMPATSWSASTTHQCSDARSIR